jgi:ubiquinone biosynthesis protein
LCTHLSPTMNPMKTILPYLETFVFGKDKNWIKLIESAVKDLVLSMITIPRNIQAVLTKANHGELEVKVRGLAESANLIYTLGHQLLYGMFIMFFGGLGYLAHGNGDIALSKGMFGISAFFLFVLGSSFLRARKWQKKGR